VPLKRNREANISHNYKRNNTMMLFASRNVREGSMIRRNMQDRQRDFIDFLIAVQAEMLSDKPVHFVLDS
jgi:hypothetical protein